MVTGKRIENYLTMKNAADVWNSCSEKLFRSALVWNSLSFVNSTYKFHMVTGKWSENFRLSPYELVTIWKKYHSPIKIIDVTVWTCHHLKKIFIFISIWICHHMVCHHMNNIHICHHFGMKFPDGDRYEFFIPNLHTVTFVTVWRLGMKIFHTCHQKSCSDGDGLIGFTIEWWRYQIQEN